jgi:putative DNA primase/helicase
MKTKELVTSVIESARALTQRGFYVVPIPSGNNHPVVDKWQNLRITLDDLESHFADDDNVGILLAPSGLGDFDADCREAIAAADVLLPHTAMVHGHLSSPRSHRYYLPTSIPKNKSFHDPRQDKTKSDRAVIAELRTNGMTVVPPSTNLRTGELVTWDSKGEPATVDGDVLVAAVAQVAAAALLGRHWPNGSRHFATLALAGMLLRARWVSDEVERFILAVGSAAQDEETSLRLHDVVTTAQRLDTEQPVTGARTLAELIGEDIVAKVREWLQLESQIESQIVDGSLHHTDMGNAQRLVERHGTNLRYCFDSGKWLTWNGRSWTADNDGQVDRFAKETIKSMYCEAGCSASVSDRGNLAKHALKSEAEGRLRAMVNLSKTEPSVPVSQSMLDADPWLLNCGNGTIDLRTGKLLAHHRSNLCTKEVPIAFDSDAKCPTWIAFLNRVMADNRALVRFLQRAVGYALTGMTSEQVLFFLYGTGANGKSTFIETCRNLVGDYAQQSDFDTFVPKESGHPRNDLARLAGARFVAAVEAAQGRQLAENVIKQATGGDVITARFLYHEPFEYSPQYKLFLVANHKPVIVGTDEAIWRRIRLIPFTVTIPPNERDKQLLEKLRGELPGILAWAVRGCLDWQRDGLGEPEAVWTATAEYRREMDVMADFVDECCVLGEDQTEDAGLLYEKFKEWSDQNGEGFLTQKKLGTQLRERGFESGKKRGNRCWFGLRLRHEDDND